MARMDEAFTLRVAGLGPESVGVLGFSGTEALGRLYEFQVDLFPRDGEPLDLSVLTGAEALLTVQVRGGRARYVHGLVRAAELVGQVGGRWRYRVWVVPKVWRLTRVQRSRIFQKKSVPEILQAVLGEAGVEYRLSLMGQYGAREYCTQYRETDWAFLSRLMEHEGLCCYFEHTEEGHVLVVGDRPNVHEELPGGGKLPLRDRDERVADEEYVYAVERVKRLRPGAVHVKDYDFEKPALDVSGKVKGGRGEGGLEVYEYPGGYVEPREGKALAKVRAEEATQAAETQNGESVCPRLTPGYRFEVECPSDGKWEGEHVLVEVVHCGEQPEVSGGRETLQGLYRNHFKSMPKAVPFRPRRLTPEPRIAGPQTATVVGPAGEEIYTDKHGRIKVLFHWDREGQEDEKASCWVRVAQAWGGLAWGAMYLPRVGQEVLVRFLEGDPDRPLVCGVLYNGNNRTPYALPEEKTKSTLKSASSPGSNGYNELRLEDAAGAEEIYVHAQKDERLLTRNDKDQQVRGYEDLRVKKDRGRTVEGNQRLSVVLDDVTLVEGNQSLQVQGNRTTTTQGSHDEAVEGNQSISVARNFTSTVTQAAMESVGAAKALTIGAGYAIDVGLAMNEAVGGSKSNEVGGAYLEHVEGSRQESVAKDMQIKVGGNTLIHGQGSATFMIGRDEQEDVGRTVSLRVEGEAGWLAKAVSLKADKFSIIVNGKLAIQMDRSGRFQIFGTKIILGD